MTKQQILEKAIQKAIDGGWKPKYKGWSWDAEEIKRWMTTWPHHRDYPLIIFNHDFAKALWGEASSETMNPGWRLKLMHMVIADDPIKYLGDNL